MESRHWLNATIVLDTGLHIGAEKNNLPADSLFRRDNGGSLTLTGRALGGSLRSTAERLAPRLGFTPCHHLREAKRKNKPCGCPVCALFGERYPDEKSTGGRASKLWIFDADIASGEKQTHIRDGVGIEDSSGTASRNIKFDYEVLPRNARIPFRLEWTGALSESDSILLAAALGEWLNYRGQLGGRSSRGLGVFHLEDLRVDALMLDSIESLMSYLHGDGQAALSKPMHDWYKNGIAAAVERRKSAGFKGPQEIPEAAAGGFVEIKFDLAYQGQALTNDPLVAALSGYDHAPLVECLWPEGQVERPVLSGSTLRGVLRARAARIARTLSDNPVCDPLARAENAPNASCDTQIKGRKTLQETPEEELCMGCRLFGNQLRGSRLWVRDAHYTGESASGGWLAQDFLAIDRFTGGGQDGAKFDAAGLTQPHFQASLVLHSPRGWELGWLTLLMRDLVEGEMVIGFGGAKGYGLAVAKNIQWTMGFLQSWDIPGAPFESGEPSGVYEIVKFTASEGNGLPDALRSPAQKWLEDFLRMVDGEAGQKQELPEGRQA